jgi:hypothetical protein
MAPWLYRIRTVRGAGYALNDRFEQAAGKE